MFLSSTLAQGHRTYVLITESFLHSAVEPVTSPTPPASSPPSPPPQRLPLPSPLPHSVPAWKTETTTSVWVLPKLAKTSYELRPANCRIQRGGQGNVHHGVPDKVEETASRPQGLVNKVKDLFHKEKGKDDHQTGPAATGESGTVD